MHAGTTAVPSSLFAWRPRRSTDLRPHRLPLLAPRLAAVLADPEGTPLTIGREAGPELGLAALEHLETVPRPGDVEALVRYAARHDESAPVRDALVAVLLNSSGTLPEPLARSAREAIMQAEWGGGRESAGLNNAPDWRAVPRRQALAERLLAERARRIRPRMHAFVTALLDGRPEAAVVPSWFLDRNWLDLRDALVGRVKNEPLKRPAVVQWLASQPADVRHRMQAVEETLIDVATQAILHAPEQAPLAPYCGASIVAERVRTAVGYRGAPARARLARYLARLPRGTAWYETISALTEAPER
jgi:hypothetical protein